MKKRVREKQFKFVVILIAMIVFVVAAGNILKEVNQSNNIQTSVALKSWGNNDSGQLGSGHLSIGQTDRKANDITTENVQAVYGGLRHSLVLTKDGEVVAWGSNKFGQIGNGQMGGKQVSPVKVDGLPKITMLATRQDHNLALDEEGKVWAWGLNMSGQLGDGTNKDNPKPTVVKNLDNVDYIAVGYRSSLAIKKDGSVWVWGGNCNLKSRDKSFFDRIAALNLSGYNDGSGGTIDHITPEDDCIQEKYLNIQSYEPIKIEGLPAVKEASVGFGHTLALAENGEVWAWGCNRYGQVGTGKVGSTDENLMPIKIEKAGKVKSISAGFRHSMTIDTQGQVWTWGHNFFGELGNGKADELVYPNPSKLSGVGEVISIAAGHDYSLAVGKDKKLYGWGQASFNQLGINDDKVSRPQILQQLASVEFTAAGGAHVIAAISKESSK